MRRQRKLVREAAQARKAARLRVQKAAPDLLAACKAALLWHQSDKWRDSPDREQREKWATQLAALHAAIAKAEGTPTT